MINLVMVNVTRRPPKGQKQQVTQELLNSHKQHDYRQQHVKTLKKGSDIGKLYAFSDQ